MRMRSRKLERIDERSSHAAAAAAASAKILIHASRQHLSEKILYKRVQKKILGRRSSLARKLLSP
jgi:hypothetical protein